MQQTDNENSQTNQKEFISVQHQILVTNLQAAGEENKQSDLGSERANHSI